MKKSEFIELLLQYSYANCLGVGFEGVYYHDDCFRSLDREDVESLVDFIEEAGMLPPESDYTQYTDGGYMRKPEWEDE